MGILSFLSSENFITVNRTIAEIVGLEAAAVLGELASEAQYWQKNNPDWDGSFFSTVENLERRTFLSAHSQRLAINRLQEQGWLTVEKRGMPAKRYIKINEEEITKVVNDKSLKILTTSDEKNERQDVKNFDGNNTINKKNIEKEKMELNSRQPSGTNPFAEIAKKEGLKLEIKVTPNSRKTSREETVALLYFISGAYPNQLKHITDPEAIINTWHEEIKENDPVDLYQAARLHIAQSKYFPTPAEIIGGIQRAQIIKQKTINTPEQPTDDAKLDDLLDFMTSE